MTDHYAEAERLLRLADERISEDWRTMTGEAKSDVLAAAQVHATLATVQRPEPSHGNHYRTIPWPPSEELVERVAKVMRDHFYPDSGPYVPRTWREQTRAVLDAIGGAGDE